MRRRLLIGLLAAGAIAGFGAGFASLGHRCHAHRSAFDEHVTKVCADAVRQAQGK